MPQTPQGPLYPRQAYPPESQPPRAFAPAMPQGFPPPPPPPGSLPVMAELAWLRDAVESQVRTIKYLLDNYNGLLAKVEAEGITPGGGTFGPPQAFAAAAIIPPGRYVAITSAAIQTTPAAGTTLTVVATTSAVAAITLMPIT